MLPAALLGGFLLLFAALFRDQLWPAPAVKVSPVLATAPSDAPAADAAKSAPPADSPAPAATNESAPTPSDAPARFQAGGWIEPDPFPVKATSLIDGIIASVHVTEGQLVRKDDPLATLVDDDARLALEQAERKLHSAEAERRVHFATIDEANQRLAAAKARQRAAQSLQSEANDQFTRLQRLPDGAVPESDVVAARLRFKRETAIAEAAGSAVSEISAEILRLQAEIQVRDAAVALATSHVAQARLAQSRTRITAPIDGRILRLHAAPGQKKMLQGDDPDSSTVALLYDPAKLQVRVDVPLADAAALAVGQPVRVFCSMLTDLALHGTVSRISGEANLQRNTLQAKVRLHQPPDVLRPDMLCRVEFLDPPVAATTSPQGGKSGVAPSVAVTGRLHTWVPVTAVRDGTVWLCDPQSRRVSRRQISAAGDSRDGYQRISQGLRPGEWVVIAPEQLSEGSRINPILVTP